MREFVETNKQMKIFLFLISIFALSQFRLIDHPWNFTPVIAFGILSGYYLKNVIYGCTLIITSMILGDLIIGFHYLILFTYVGLLFSVIIGKYLKQLKTVQLFLSSIISSLVFFTVSNFGVWLLSGFYAKSFQGLVDCYIAGIPFFRNTLISTIIFVFILKWVFDQLKLNSPLIKQKKYS